MSHVKVSILNGETTILHYVKDLEDLKQKASDEFSINANKFYNIENGLEVDSNECLESLITKFNDKDENELYLLALDEDTKISSECRKYMKYPDFWRISSLIEELIEAENVDVCFLVDYTNRVYEYIEKIKDIFKVIKSILKKQFKNFKLRVAFAGYQDFSDTNITVFKFTKDLNSFITYLDDLKEIHASASPFADVFGGLDEVIKLKWKYPSRILFHICERPSHGIQFHSNSIIDPYADQDPRGLRISDLLKELNFLNIKYFFVELIPEMTGKMIDEFNTELDNIDGNLIEVLTIQSSNDLSKTLISSIISTINQAQKAVYYNTSNKIRKDILIDKYSLRWAPSNFEQLTAKLYNFRFNGNLSTLKNLMSQYQSIKEIDPQITYRTRSQASIGNFIEILEKSVDVLFCPISFAKGNTHYVYAVMLDSSDGKIKCVIKNSLFENDKNDTFNCNASLLAKQVIGKYLAKTYFKMNPLVNKSVRFANLKLIYIEELEQYFIIEKYIETPYSKWNKNIGSVDDVELAESLDAFFHWTYKETGEYLVVTDYHGVRLNNTNDYILKDPTISCVERQFTASDLGEIGIDMFLQTHICDYLCANKTKSKSASKTKKDEISESDSFDEYI